MDAPGLEAMHLTQVNRTTNGKYVTASLSHPGATRFCFGGLFFTSSSSVTRFFLRFVAGAHASRPCAAGASQEHGRGARGRCAERRVAGAQQPVASAMPLKIASSGHRVSRPWM